MKIVIVGGSHAGIACAKRAREEYPESEVIIYERKAEVCFISQSIPQYLMGQNNLASHSTYTSVRELEDLDIQVKTRTTIENINATTKQLIYTEKDSEIPLTDIFDKLVLATGSYPVIPPIRGVINENVYFVKNKQDAFALRKFMDKKKVVAVMGGGMIGVELARIFRNKGMDVYIVQAGNRILNKYVDEEVSEEIRSLLEDEGIKIHTSSLVVDIKDISSTKLSKKGKKLAVYTENKQINVDGVVVAIGFRPNSTLLMDQVLLGEMGAIEVDEFMRTSADDIFAAGDCATTNMKQVERKIYLPHASDAFREGAVAAVNLIKPNQMITPSQGTYAMNLEGYSICVSGLSKETARKEGYDAELVYLENHFINSDDYIKIWITYDQKNHKFLGIQAMGTVPNLASYANIISVAIQQDMTIEDMEFADFYFEHGFKNPDSFLKIIAQKVREQVRQRQGARNLNVK